MASTVLPNGIIIPEKYSRDWYADLYHNWQELDNLLGGGGGGGANDGTLTIQKNGATVTTFSANQATDATANIEVPTKTSDLTNDSNFVQSSDLATVATSGSYNDLTDTPTIPTVNNATLTIQRNGTTVDTFTANSSTDKTVNIQCVDLTNAQTVGGIKTFSDAPVVSAITLDGKTIDTDADGNMTYDGHIVDTIEEQGDGYIRYSNGLQICWGYAVGSNIVAWEDRLFPKPFKDALIYMTATQVYASNDRDNLKNASVGVAVYSNTTFSVTVYNSSFWSVNYHAIGHWK